MQVKRVLAATAITVGLGSAGLGFAGTATADDRWWLPKPPSPGHVGQIVNVPPGHVGQIVGVPPGHWDKPWKWVK